VAQGVDPELKLLVPQKKNKKGMPGDGRERLGNQYQPSSWKRACIVWRRLL
jgi:hypothetical protein